MTPPCEFTAEAAREMTGRCTLHGYALGPHGGAESIFGTWRCLEGDDGPEIQGLREQITSLGPGPGILWADWPKADKDEWLRLSEAMGQARKRCRQSWVFRVPEAPAVPAKEVSDDS